MKKTAVKLNSTTLAVAKPCTFVATGLQKVTLHFKCRRIAVELQIMQFKCHVMKTQSKCNATISCIRNSQCNDHAIVI